MTQLNVRMTASISYALVGAAFMAVAVAKDLGVGLEALLFLCAASIGAWTVGFFFAPWIGNDRVNPLIAIMIPFVATAIGASFGSMLLLLFLRDLLSFWEGLLMGPFVVFGLMVTSWCGPIWIIGMGVSHVAVRNHRMKSAQNGTGNADIR